MNLLLKVCFVTFLIIPLKSFAVDCEPLKPSKPIDEKTKTEISGELSGIFSKLVNGEAEYINESIKEDILPKYKNADQLFMWERSIYLACEMVSDKTLELDSDDRKLILASIFSASVSPPVSIDNFGELTEKISFNSHKIGRRVKEYGKNTIVRKLNDGNKYATSRINRGYFEIKKKNISQPISISIRALFSGTNRNIYLNLYSSKKEVVKTDFYLGHHSSDSKVMYGETTYAITNDSNLSNQVKLNKNGWNTFKFEINEGDAALFINNAYINTAIINEDSKITGIRIDNFGANDGIYYVEFSSL